MERILRGVMRYRNTTRAQMVKEFQKVRDHPEVRIIIISSPLAVIYIKELFKWHVKNNSNFKWVQGIMCFKKCIDKPYVWWCGGPSFLIWRRVITFIIIFIIDNFLRQKICSIHKICFSPKQCSSRVWTVEWFPPDSQRHMWVTCLLVCIAFFFIKYFIHKYHL